MLVDAAFPCFWISQRALMQCYRSPYCNFVHSSDEPNKYDFGDTFHHLSRDQMKKAEGDWEGRERR